jgi:4-aminobutyrate--pyruvate transaminase
VRFIVQYYNATGRPAKKHFIALERGYHGSSSTGAGLTALPAFHRGFDLPLPDAALHPLALPLPHPVGGDPQALIAASVAALRAKVAELGADNVAAFFCEPIQGSGGVIVPPKGWLKAMREACRELDILFVADEVITGFGRTGPMFACEAEGVEPDLMTVAKGLTSGYVPMGALLMSERSTPASPTARRPARGGPRRHLFGAPGERRRGAGSAAALRRRRRARQRPARRAHFEAGLRSAARHPLVGDARSPRPAGRAGAGERQDDQGRLRPGAAAVRAHRRRGYRNGLVFRAFGDNILGFAPALCFTKTSSSSCSSG